MSGTASNVLVNRVPAFYRFQIDFTLCARPTSVNRNFKYSNRQKQAKDLIVFKEIALFMDPDTYTSNGKYTGKNIVN